MKRIKPLFLLLLLLVCSLVPMGVYTGSAENGYRPEPKVYVTEYGEKYHSYGCQYLRESCIAIGIYKAQSKGYTACSKCRGIPSGTIMEWGIISDNDSSTSTIKEKDGNNGVGIGGIISTTIALLFGGITAMTVIGIGLDNTLYIKDYSKRFRSIKFWPLFLLILSALGCAIWLFIKDIPIWGYFAVEITTILFAFAFIWDFY